MSFRESSQDCSSSIMVAVISILIFLLPFGAAGQVFVPDESGIPDYTGDISSIWGDYDDDGDLDLFLSIPALIFRNDGDSFVEVPIMNIAPNRDKTLKLGDFDNDGDLDIINIDWSMFRILRNEGSDVYTQFQTIFDFQRIEVSLGSESGIWTDFDGDGDLDICMSGRTHDEKLVTSFYRNDGDEGFVLSDKSIPGIAGFVSQMDVDNDGDVDYLINGKDEDNNDRSGLFLNNYPDDFQQDENIFTRGIWGVIDWADINQDACPDVIVTGTRMNTNIDNQNAMYINIDGYFERSPVYFGPRFFSHGSFGDYDNDGDSDFLFSSGYLHDTCSVALYINNQSQGFSIIDSILEGWQNALISPADYDNDGDLDFFRSGRIYEGSASYFNLNEMYENKVSQMNHSPDPPSDLRTAIIGNVVTLEWQEAFDDLTNGKSLSYNVRVGTSLLGIDIVSPHSDLQTGYRKLVGLGNAFFGNDYKLKNLVPGKYYWQVQAIDNNYLGSEFSPIDSFTVEEPFTPVTGFPPLYGSSISWGDYDDDNDMDILISGKIPSEWSVNNFATKIYGNQNSHSFIEIADLDSVWNSSVSWVDFDNDNDLDIFIAGSNVNRVYSSEWAYSDSGTPSHHLYINEGDSFFELDVNVDMDVYDYFYSDGYTDWGDFDNDGDNDLLISGINQTAIYENIEGRDLKSKAVYQGGGKAVWCDLDNDFDLDFICNSGIYFNMSDGNFLLDEIAYSPDPVKSSYFSGVYDYNNDGFLDILHCYVSKEADRRTELLLNEKIKKGRFSAVDCGLQALNSGHVDIGDYNNDGLTDLFFTRTLGSFPDIIYQCTSDFEYEIKYPGFPKYTDSISIAWGNFDNDSDLDLLVSGSFYGEGSIAKVFSNNGNWPNDPPEAPDNLQSFTVGNGIHLQWDSSTDLQGYSEGLSYNIRIGRRKGGCEVMSPMADLNTGYRKISKMGNVHLNKGWRIDSLALGKYYWSVQAIDQSYLGGPWAVEDSFEILAINVDFDADTVCQGSFVQFIDKSLIRGVSVDSWTWDFGDGSSSEQNPQYIFGSAGSHEVALTVVSGSERFTETKQVYVKPSPVAKFESDEVCLGELTSFQNQSITDGIDIESWLWDYNDGITSSSKDPQPHGFVNPGTYNVSLTTKAENGCSDTIQKVISVISKPDGKITEEGTMCVDLGYHLRTVEVPGYTYQWKFAGTDLAGANRASYSPDLPGDYSVVVNSQCGEVSASYTVEKPELSIVESGSPCKDANYTLATQQYASYSYQWKYQGIDILDATQSTLQPDNVGEYTVEVQTPCGEVSASHIIEAPSYYIITEGIPCKGDNFVLKTEDWVANSYQWRYQGTRIEGATKALHYPDRPGSYSVDIQTPCGLYSADYNVAFITGPAKPDVYIRGPEVWYLACSNDSADEYQWYRDGDLIEGAINSIYIPNQQLGMYQVRISNGGECFTGSDPVYLPGSYTGIKEEPFDGLKIYPNPTPGVFIIEMDNLIMGDLLIDVFTEQGSKVINIKFLKETSHFVAQVDLSAQPAGIYSIKMILADYKVSRNLVVSD